MAKAKKKIRIEKPDPIVYRKPTVGSAGSTEWDSMDGMLRKRHVTTVYGVAVPSRWQAWQFRGIWRMILECRSEKRVDEKLAKIKAEIDAAE